MKEKETKTQSQVPSKGIRVVKVILNTIINILIVLVLVTSILIAVLSLSSKANNGVATIFGYTFHTIQSPSMEGGNPDFDGGDYKVGDLVIGKATDASAEFELGDIVSYKTVNLETGEGVLICHRIVDVFENEGSLCYQTQGDANDNPDQHAHGEYISAVSIKSVCYDADYHGAVLKGWGKTLDYIREPQGFFFAVLLPMIIFFMYEIVRVVINAMNYKKSKAESDKEDAEKEKQEAVKAAVAAALAEKEKQDSAAEADSDKSAGSAPAKESAVSDEELEEFRRFREFKKMQQAKQEESDPKDTDSEE